MTRRDTDGYRAHRQARELAIDPLEQERVAAARAAVTIARQRLEHIRREHIRGSAGRTDVAAAEAALSRALDQLDHAAGTGWRT